MDTSFRGFVLTVACLLSGCADRVEEAQILKEVNEALSREQVGCNVAVEYKGVGDGDSDTAYAVVEINIKNDKKSSHLDVELMLRHQQNGVWLITEDSSKQLLSKVKNLCSQ
jgi:hypothetical protein